MLNFRTTTEVKHAERRITKIIGDYFNWNCALQIQLSESKSETCVIVNYAPRHGKSELASDKELFGKKLTRTQLRDFCIVNSAVLGNLAKQFMKFSESQTVDNEVTYPN